MIFLDIGSHNGQTLEEVVEWPFDLIYGFEPMPAQQAILQEKFGHLDNVVLCPYGLSDQTGTFPVYGGNEICEASMFASKADVDASVVTDCEFVAASEFFASYVAEACIVKMNCEGAEIPILNDLIDSGEIDKITALTFDLDIRRCAGLEYQADELLARLADYGFDRYRISGEHFDPNVPHRQKIATWLESLL